MLCGTGGKALLFIALISIRKAERKLRKKGF
jgi:hypothetical protein